MGISFALAAQGDDPRPAHRRRRPGPGHRHPELPRGGGHRPAPAPGGAGSRARSFLDGRPCPASVEPVFALLTVLMVGSLQPLMPWLLSFAAGAMLYVVVEELIPGAHLEDHSSRSGTLGVMAGFLLMMILDVALG